MNKNLQKVETGYPIINMMKFFSYATCEKNIGRWVIFGDMGITVAYRAVTALFTRNSETVFDVTISSC